MDLLNNAGRIDTAVKGLGIMLKPQNALVRLLMKNWPLALLAGAAIGTQLWRRHKKGELSWYTGATDAGMVVGPLVSIFILQNIARDAQRFDEMIKAQKDEVTATKKLAMTPGGNHPPIHPAMQTLPVTSPGDPPGGLEVIDPGQILEKVM